MRVLLDTHLLLWAALGDSQLSEAAVTAINDPANSLVFSTASIWEVVIKAPLGRRDFKVNPHQLRTQLLDNGYEELGITSHHVLAVASLPDLHKDPFDRILVAQASVENLTLFTVDPIVASYPGAITRV